MSALRRYVPLPNKPHYRTVSEGRNPATLHPLSPRRTARPVTTCIGVRNARPTSSEDCSAMASESRHTWGMATIDPIRRGGGWLRWSGGWSADSRRAGSRGSGKALAGRGRCCGGIRREITPTPRNRLRSGRAGIGFVSRRGGLGTRWGPCRASDVSLDCRSGLTRSRERHDYPRFRIEGSATPLLPIRPEGARLPKGTEAGATRTDGPPTSAPRCVRPQVAWIGDR